ncbi:MAG: hypothetical protein ACTHJ5_12380 [Ilyomonas sp.]
MALKNNHVTKVRATSYENTNTPVNDFMLEQDISPDAKTITIHSSYPSSGSTVTITQYENDKLVKTYDSSGNVVTTTSYVYDDEGRLKTISTQTDDAFMDSHSHEVHQWFYDNGTPSYMLRIKDNADTTNIRFIKDEEGNIGQENWIKKGRTIESYYYYFNDKNELTDIVRYNSRAKKMLPDFLYEYAANGRVDQMTQMPAGSSNYMIWKYVYNDKGLKQKELLYNKQNQLVGRIEFQYQ